jgi:transposase
MLRMDQYAYIRIAKRVYGKSIRQIRRETGHSRNTIRKVLREEPYVYCRREHQPYPVLGPYLNIIDKWLEQDKERPKKQRHTARRIYHRLVEEQGFQGSENTVRRYVREAKVRLGVGAPRAFIPLEPELGQEAEVDWGTALAVISGQVGRYKFFCMRSKSSGKHFVQFYPCERQQAFFDGQIQAFRFFGGVFPVLIYDNLTTAVQKVLRGKKRLEQEAFTRFHAYYNFTPRFCNVASGHEKGGVEGLIGYVRRNYLVPIPEAASLEELNQKVLKQCLAYGEHRLQGRENTVNEMFEQEKSYLLPLPEIAFSNIQTTDTKVDRYSTVIVDKNRYSVPTRYAGLKVKVSLGVNQVEIFRDGVRVASHRRLYGNNKWSLDPDHYLELIQRRPEAFNSARPIRQWRTKWPSCLERLLERFQHSQGETKGIKDFISVLMLYRDYRADEVEAAVEKALDVHISCSQGVKHLLLPCAQSSSGSAQSLESWPALPPADVSVYGQLGGVK